MTQREWKARQQGVPDWIIRILRPEFECDEEVKEGAKRAVEDGVVCWWAPVGRGE